MDSFEEALTNTLGLGCKTSAILFTWGRIFSKKGRLEIDREKKIEILQAD